jgi:hypothetical protein
MGVAWFVYSGAGEVELCFVCGRRESTHPSVRVGRAFDYRVCYAVLVCPHPQPLSQAWERRFYSGVPPE